MVASIGIDFGTTNTVLALAAADGSVTTASFRVDGEESGVDTERLQLFHTEQRRQYARLRADQTRGIPRVRRSVLDDIQVDGGQDGAQNGKGREAVVATRRDGQAPRVWRRARRSDGTGTGTGTGTGAGAGGADFTVVRSR